jgi:ferredoxin
LGNILQKKENIEMPVRKIVKFDEEKCDGCGLCVPSCAEGAIQIIDGKARLVSDTFCDGLGACLGECPMDAITIEDREAPEFDEAAAMAHVAAEQPSPKAHHSVPHSCPSARLRDFEGTPSAQPADTERSRQASALTSWPVQLTLVPPHAPFLKNANLLLSADCAPFAYPDFHQDFLKGKSLLIACPKLDDTEAYLHKLTQIIQQARPASITVLRMEVPCCGGLTWLVRKAIVKAGLQIPVEEITLGIQGGVLSSV